MTTSRPIFLFGAGRSGATIVHRIFSEHPQLAWLTALADKYPRWPGLSRSVLHMAGFPPSEWLIRKILPPGECYSFWEHYIKGFRAPCRDLVASDVSTRCRQRIDDIFNKVTTKKRDRLLMKTTGWPRVGFLSEIFPDAKFVHVIRDGRAVANSLLEAAFWRGWEGPDNWQWGPLSEAYRAEWNKHGQSFVALAGIQWKILMDAAEEARQYVDAGQWMEVKYEDICEDPIFTLMGMAEFCDVEWNSVFDARLKKYKLRNANDKYRKDLSPAQQEILQSVLEEHLAKYGYE